MRRSLVQAFADVFTELADGAGYDFTGFRNDPLGWFKVALAFEPWAAQEEVARACGADDAWVTWRSGHGVGKSTLLSALALHFASTRGAGARVILTSSTAANLREAVWTELSRLWRTAKVPLGGSLALLPSTGLRWADGRQIVGISADTPEAFAGIRAREMFIICDESSSEAIDRVRDALLGNLSGGGKLLLSGNPTKASGFFFESHKSDRFVKIHTPSTASPNVVAGRTVLPGLVRREWVEDRAQDWGRSSVMFKIRVLGEFVEIAEGRLFTPDMLTEAVARWESTPATGRLVIGCDPAGPGSDGDASGFVGKRGHKVLFAQTRMALSPDAHVSELLGLIALHRGEHAAAPLIIVDRDGPVGARVWAALHGYQQTHPDVYALCGIRGSEIAKRRPQEIDKMRDELWFCLVDAFRDGLALPPGCTQLEGDLAAIRFDRLVNGRAKVIAKPQIRRELGGHRSPDLGDALALAAYEPVEIRGEWLAHARSRDVTDPWETTDAMMRGATGHDVYDWDRAYRGGRR
jgi:hypothetical protein